jgi:tetratricopeptide (TPR) repeat protein
LFTAWRRFVEGLAAARPTVLVFEDLHWADEALLAFLEYLAEWAEGVPLLVLCMARPELYERHPGWAGGIRNVTTINLPPLSDRETAELVSFLITSTVLSPEVEQGVLERAGGNPLYAEEFVRLLGDRGLAAGETKLPESLQALIAARLDTLSADRKSLLQDAAVLGKVFWVGALAEIGGRDEGELELALHELARKELVRPARMSSMEGESEYSFSHLLVRDVAYSQIPRAERARRHRSAAAWIERKAGERVEDLAELLAHHYVQALELAEAAGDTEQAEELARPARRFLMLAGERALGLDTAQAESRLARALELCPADDPERPELLLRWADAAFQASRPREAATALDEALDLFRARGEKEGQARALILLGHVTQRLGEGRLVALAAEAVALLEQEPPGPTLVAAYTQLAAAHFLTGLHGEAIAAADRACALAKKLGLPEPARALGARGNARAYLGDPDGLVEMERALSLHIEHGEGNQAGVLQNNLAIARYPLQGPARSLADFEQGIAFSEQRGLASQADAMEADCPGLLVELGRPEEALERAGALAAAVEVSGGTWVLSWVRALELATHLARGESEGASGIADWLVEAARPQAMADVTVEVLAPVAAARLAAGAPEQASALLAEIEQTPGARETPYYARQLAAMLRTALAVGDREVAQRLADGIEPRYPLREHALCTARAQLAEHAGDHDSAAALYGEAARRWEQFGNVCERAYALLGQGRCLVALGDPSAEQSLRQAAELFTSMGYKPALAETEKLLARAAAPAP